MGKGILLVSKFRKLWLPNYIRTRWNRDLTDDIPSNIIYWLFLWSFVPSNLVDHVTDAADCSRSKKCLLWLQTFSKYILRNLWHSNNVPQFVFWASLHATSGSDHKMHLLLIVWSQIKESANCVSRKHFGVLVPQNYQTFQWNGRNMIPAYSLHLYFMLFYILPHGVCFISCLEVKRGLEIWRTR